MAKVRFKTNEVNTTYILLQFKSETPITTGLKRTFEIVRKPDQFNVELIFFTKEVDTRHRRGRAVQLLYAPLPRSLQDVLGGFLATSHRKILARMPSERIS